MGTMTWEQVCKRAGGRRGYNANRQLRASYRRYQLATLMLEQAGRYKGRGGTHGMVAALARTLGVHPSTISRDIAALEEEWRQSGDACRVCGGTIWPGARLGLESEE